MCGYQCPFLQFCCQEHFAHHLFIFFLLFFPGLLFLHNFSWLMTFWRVESLLRKFFSPTDVNDCAAQPCSNGGICRDLDGDYTCQCPSPYVGKQCQLRTFTFIFLKLVKNRLHLNTNYCCKEDFPISWKHFISVLHEGLSKGEFFFLFC